jgi:lambda repressor-like predicted transcriptional regulator
MANKQLRDAIQNAGIDIQELADQIRVDPKTIERWVAGRTPYPRYRSRLARALSTTQQQLWPQLAPEPVPDRPRTGQGQASGTNDNTTDGSAGSADQDDDAVETGDADHDDDVGYQGDEYDTNYGEHEQLVPVYPTVGDLAVPGWRALVKEAGVQIDLLDLTLNHLLIEPKDVELLAGKAMEGVPVRVLISHPESAHLTITEAEAQGTHKLTTRSTLSDQALEALELLRTEAAQGIEVRLFVAAGYHSIIRADSQQLISPHLYATSAWQGPLMWLHAERQPVLFKQFEGHYQRIWQHAQPVQPASS